MMLKVLDQTQVASGSAAQVLRLQTWRPQVTSREQLVAAALSARAIASQAVRQACLSPRLPRQHLVLSRPAVWELRTPTHKEVQLGQLGRPRMEVMQATMRKRRKRTMLPLMLRLEGERTHPLALLSALQLTCIAGSAACAHSPTQSRRQHPPCDDSQLPWLLGAMRSGA